MMYVPAHFNADGQLVLIDAGCEKSMYASDITRTFPVSGKFTDPQRDLYEAVLSAQKACIKKCKVEDRVSLNELHRASTSTSSPLRYDVDGQVV